ncbi:MAG: glycerol-3-phosphate dehydrogenase/oxidase [Candidatus Marinimicrobia bacterium]|jgi:glycerol-3-phosphate dehydrogenase|nr:glycerol-3-phosphate dehydrogenase/oxidase [Candidatus Neomarinimicrobiota bacterium]MBT5758954.1 glycerol-3-phosphate dehydrogenase/oxidase [Candidatus Neomarinimicrobiota bacterium]MBT6981468.1 glycerol-3-phosphate dehydrogenase/oxidase [Candidatus Neomarinimicrobiota bacterium]MBT7119352.1 glycerol-3-phosphate dehydrogenase/oxidase [Candidatus Neomarinimicrobiota bacterium]MBT7520222.1 glycerol-3-phosphate dehydrogenase/oxidase [Candidatus Neomarinimicrobiota bacterium]
MKVIVIGGGINGLCCAWQLALNDVSVSLLEKSKIMSQTSSASSKLLHGGLRYLENFEFNLVYESLRERNWWLEKVPELTNELHMILPIYKNGPRNKWAIKIGLLYYDFLAGKGNISKHKWIPKKELVLLSPELNKKDLIGGFRFSDGQMDDYKLGMWVAKQAKNDGVKIFENTKVEKIDLDGNIIINGEMEKYDYIINTCGPWASELLNKSGLNGKYKLDLIRGSHILIKGEPSQPYFLQTGNDGRIFFVLPYNGKTLIGTTEIRQNLSEPIIPSDEEIAYLLDEYNHYFIKQKTTKDIIEKFAGVRPLISSSSNPKNIKREYKIETMGKIVNIYGGKWTTAMSLGRKVVKKILA